MTGLPADADVRAAVAAAAVAIDSLAGLAPRADLDRAPPLSFPRQHRFARLGRGSASRAGQILRALIWLALAAFIVGIARPQLGKSLTNVEASGIDIMLVLDVSNSMLAKDFTIGGEEATRLDAVREVTRKFIEARPNDRIGMIAFGTRPYIVSPMTLDHEWLLQNLDRVRIGLVEGSTAIGSAMASAGNRLNDKQSKSRVIVLLTDGDNNAGKIPPNTAAEALKALHIHLYAIGIGTNGVAPFPVMDEQTGQVVTDRRGNVYYQRAEVSFNEKGLREVAQIADGKFYRATDTQSLEDIYRTSTSWKKQRSAPGNINNTEICFRCASRLVADC